MPLKVRGSTSSDQSVRDTGQEHTAACRVLFSPNRSQNPCAGSLPPSWASPNAFPRLLDLRVHKNNIVGGLGLQAVRTAGSTVRRCPRMLPAGSMLLTPLAELALQVLYPVNGVPPTRSQH